MSGLATCSGIWIVRPAFKSISCRRSGIGSESVYQNGRPDFPLRGIALRLERRSFRPNQHSSCYRPSGGAWKRSLSQCRYTPLEVGDATLCRLKGCHSQGATRLEALDNIRDAIREWLASADDDRTVFNVTEEEVTAVKCRKSPASVPSRPCACLRNSAIVSSGRASTS
jgi:hypothetical protein